MIIIGSARIDEHGKSTGGKAGDQKQKTTPDYKGEVSMQNFYVSSKGWNILRAKDSAVAANIALAMTVACNNPNIGYNQARRLDIIKAGTHATAPTSCDCSSLVRQCIRESGIDVGNFPVREADLHKRHCSVFGRHHSHKNQRTHLRGHFRCNEVGIRPDRHANGQEWQQGKQRQATPAQPQSVRRQA